MSKVAIIDADSLLYYEMGKPTLEEALEGLRSRIHQILLETNSTYYIGYLTLGKCYRYEKAKSKPYKNGRSKAKPKPPIFYALRAALQQDPYNFVGFNTVEADDLVAISADILQDSGYEFVIASPDKDVINQIPGTHYNYGKAETIVTTEEMAEKFLWTQVLMGDSTDGIPGIPGMGIKGAEKLLDDIPDVYTMSQVCLDAYMAKFGRDRGMHKFYETYTLVRILRDNEELEDQCGIRLPQTLLVLRESETLEIPETSEEDTEEVTGEKPRLWE